MSPSAARGTAPGGAVLFVAALLLQAACLGAAARPPASGRSPPGLRERTPPFAAAALWAAELVPRACDVCEKQGDKIACDVDQCEWRKVPATWRYAWNNLRLAVERAEGRHRGPLGAEVHEQLATLHGFIDQLGDDLGLWFSNWMRASTAVREMVDFLQPWLAPEAYVPGPPLLVPAGNHGLRFPTRGRSVQVPVDGDPGARVTLSNGVEMPLLGLGVADLPADSGEAYQSVRWALELGYRHIDTAHIYRNEHEVGRALRDSGVPRDQVFVVTKLSDQDEYLEGARPRFMLQLEALGVDYVDVYMLHSPGRGPESRKAAWRDLEALHEEGFIRALGVSSFSIAQLEELFDFARVKPVYLQNKFSPYDPGSDHEARNQHSVMEWALAHGLTVVGYSIIKPAKTSYYLEPLQDPHVSEIAGRIGRSPSQVLHRWALQLGLAVIPRSSRREGIAENARLFDFLLEEADMRLLNGLASLSAGTPGRRCPAWAEDVYGLGALPEAM